VIRNRNVRQTDPLRYAPPLADSGNVQLRRLAPILELRFGIPHQDAESRQKAQDTLYLAHKHTISSPAEN
jgi:hypothetical protein